jgi:hypothetical protein
MRYVTIKAMVDMCFVGAGFAELGLVTRSEGRGLVTRNEGRVSYYSRPKKRTLWFVDQEIQR